MVDAPLADAPDGVDASAWTAACAAVRAYCGWHVAPSAEETVVLDGSGSTFQNLPSMFVTDVALVTEDGDDLDDSTYEWSLIGQLWRSYPWTGHFRGLSVTFTHGYDECPAEVLTVLGELAAAGGRGGIKSVTSDSTSISYEGAMSGSQRTILDAYRIPPRP